MALLASVFGVMLWPLYYASQLSGFPDPLKLAFYPNMAHAHLMIEGFVGGFALGFVATAMPKLLEAPSFKPWQIFAFAALHLSYCTLHLCGFTRSGDALFAVMMGIFIIQLLVKIAPGKTVPPPSMILAALGLVGGTLGAAWMAAVGSTGAVTEYAFAQRLLYQTFILLPLLGVGGYIFPMILGTTNFQAQLNGTRITRAWKTKALESTVLGILLILTYWIEVQSGENNPEKPMAWVRFALSFVWLTKESGWLKRSGTGSGAMPFGLRAGIVCLLGCFLTTGLLQQHRIALDHILYVGGFALITITVASRVLLAHSGETHKLNIWAKPLTWSAGLIIFTMLTRVSADFIPKVTISHHVYAALLWVIVAFIWAIALLPSVKKYPAPPAPAILPKKKKSTSFMDMDFRK